MEKVMQTTFADVLESVETLPKDEKEMLLEIVRKRLIDERRVEIAREIEAAEAEYAAGLCKPATVDEIMLEILS